MTVTLILTSSWPIPIFTIMFQFIDPDDDDLDTELYLTQPPYFSL